MSAFTIYVILSYVYSLTSKIDDWKQGWVTFSSKSDWFTVLLVLIAPLYFGVSLVCLVLGKLVSKIRGINDSSGFKYAPLASFSWNKTQTSEIESYQNVALGTSRYSVHCEYSFDAGGWSIGLGWLLLSWGWFTRPISSKEG